MTLVATGGGAITTAECQMALALGVSVVLVESRRETTVERTLSLPPWHDHRQLTRVPRDVRRLRAALGLD
jgi:shikimate kinase